MPVLFRCFQCNQVLRAPKARVGTVVPCPKCGAELLVPEPPEPEPEPVPTQVFAGTHSNGSGEASDSEAETRGAASHSAEMHVAVSTHQAPATADPGSSSVTVADTPLESRRAGTLGHPSPAAASGVESDFPSIHIEPQPILPQGGQRRFADQPSPGHPRDVVIPRMALAGWSLFGILALFVAFIAGLMAGHFLWVVKVVHT